VNEVWIINDEIVYSGPRNFIKGRRPKSDWNFAFYDKESGEVYGKRILTEGSYPWIFRPGDKPMLHFFAEEEFTPDGAFEYYINYLIGEIQ